MSFAETIAIGNAFVDGQMNFRNYNFNDTRLFVGTPPNALKGMNAISAEHLNSTSKLVMSLTNKGTFVNNANLAGIISVEILAGTPSAALMALNDAAGIPFPILGVDSQSGGTSFIAGDKCRLVQNPPWVRGATVGMQTFSFHTPLLIKSHGVRLSE